MDDQAEAREPVGIAEEAVAESAVATDAALISLVAEGTLLEEEAQLAEADDKVARLFKAMFFKTFSFIPCFPPSSSSGSFSSFSFSMYCKK